MKTVKGVSDLTGVSICTLHHYDKIGLLKPSYVSEAGYRYYSDGDIEKLQTIMLFRELRFSLKEINEIVNNPRFDRRKALVQQIELYRLEIEHLKGLMSFAERLLKEGGLNMEFNVFEKKELEAYAAEAKAAWGDTGPYREYEQKTASRSSAQESAIQNGLMSIFAQMGRVRNSNASSLESQELVSKLNRYISDNCFACTPQIFASLGQMYVCDERMKQNIDRVGGSGTAEFASKAISLYCTRADENAQ